MGEGFQQDADAAYKWFTEAYYDYAEMFMNRIERGEQRLPSVTCRTNMNSNHRDTMRFH